MLLTLCMIFPLVQTGELILRKSVFNLPELIVLFTGFLCIGVARLSSSNIIQITFGNFIDFKTEIAFTDSIKTNPFGSFLLLVNFLVSFTLLFLLSAKVYLNRELDQIFFAAGLTCVVALIFLTSSILIAFVTGDSSSMRFGQFLNVNFIHTIGFISFILSILWIFNPGSGSIFLYISIISLGIAYLVRLLKILSVVLREKIPIYYLILYLCTLEILPIYLYVNLFWKYFQI